MPLKILVINSSFEKNNLLTQAFKSLGQNFSFRLWSDKRPLIELFRQNHWPAKKIFLGPSLNNASTTLLLLILLLPLQLIFFFLLLNLKLRRQVDLIVCLDLKEKVIITPMARLIGLKAVWLEDPALNYRRLNKILIWLYRINFRWAKIAVFNNYDKLQLKNLGCRDADISLIPPAVKIFPYQENIFNKLAASGQTSFHRKYFTVGAVIALDQKQKIETVFQAVKISLAVIPNIQLIIIGEGEERKNLSWLAKKMGIENLVWLVGEQAQLKKWLDSFDVFLASGYYLKLDDYGNVLEAMAAELPVLAPRHLGLEDLVIENKTGALIDSDNSEMLARQIIKLHQDKRLRRHLGKNGQERVKQLFTMEKMVEAMEQIFTCKNKFL